MQEAMSAQSGEAKVLSEEAATLRNELDTVLKETQVRSCVLPPATINGRSRLRSTS